MSQYFYSIFYVQVGLVTLNALRIYCGIFWIVKELDRSKIYGSANFTTEVGYLCIAIRTGVSYSCLIKSGPHDVTLTGWVSVSIM